MNRKLFALRHFCSLFSFLCASLIFFCQLYAEESATILSFKSGQKIGENSHVSGLVLHNEYLRLKLLDGSSETAVEIKNCNSKGNKWCSGLYQVQPAPNFKPSETLLKSVLLHLDALQGPDASHSIFSKINNDAKPNIEDNFKAEAEAEIRQNDIDDLEINLRGGYLAIFLLAILLLLFVTKKIQNLGKIFERLLISIARHADWLACHLKMKNINAPQSNLNRKSYINALFLFIAVLSFFGLFHLDPPSYSDTYEYGLYAKNCAVDNICPSLGAEFTIKGIYSGALWNNIILLANNMGLSLFALHVLVIFCYAIAIALFYLFVKRFLASALASMSALAFLLFSLILVEYPILWNDSLQPLFMALFLISIFNLLESGRLKFAMLSGFTFALLVETHLILLILAPVFLIIVLIAGRRLILSAASALGMYLLTFSCISYDAMWVNLLWLFKSGYLVLFTCIMLLCALFALLVRRMYQKRYTPHRNLVIFYSITLFAICIVTMLGIMHGFDFGLPHFEAALPGVAVFVAQLMTSLKKRLLMKFNHLYVLEAFPALPGVLLISLGLLFWYLLQITHSPIIASCSRWTVSDMRFIGEKLNSQNYSFDYLQRHLQGLGRGSLLRAMLYHEDKDNNVSNNNDLLLFKANDTILLDTKKHQLEKYDLLRGKKLYIRKIDSWLNRRVSKVCVSYSKDSNIAPQCVTIDLNMPYGAANSSADYIERFYNLEAAVGESFRRAGKELPRFKVEQISIAIPIISADENRKHVFAIADEYCRSDWFVKNRIGSLEIETINERVVRFSGSAETGAELVLMNQPQNGELDGIYYPALIELPDFGEQLDEVLSMTSKAESKTLRAIHRFIGENAE